MCPNSPSPLETFTILELGLDEAGQYAGRLLADLGARVITIEPRDGNATRQLPPFFHDKAGHQRSVPHEYLNAGKESVAIDLEDEVSTAILRKFDASADLILVGAEYNGRVPHDLRMSVVCTSLYGLPSGRATAPSTSFTRFHAGGSSSLMPTSRPTTPGTLASECFSGAGIAMTALTLLLSRVRDSHDTGVRADHSEQAHLVNLEKMFIARISKDKAVVTRDSHRYPFGGAVRCSDGFVSMLINEKHQWKGFCDAIGKPEWATDERFATGSHRFRMKDEIEKALIPWCASRSRREVVDAMRGRQVPIGSVNEVGELLDDEILRARKFIRDVQTPYGQVAAVSLPFGSDPLWEATRARRWFAPQIGEHTTEILGKLGFGDEQIQVLQCLNLIRSEHVAR
jgi:crotonobetainyl-CoA:carnitine CoA-transferase CaiB-like acyl-CoA transferase